MLQRRYNALCTVSHLTHSTVCLIHAGPMFKQKITSCPDMSIIFTGYDAAIVDFSTDIDCQFLGDFVATLWSVLLLVQL